MSPRIEVSLIALSLLISGPPGCGASGQYLDICGQQSEINLEPNDYASSVVIKLKPDSRNNCAIKVTAPSTHVINMQWDQKAPQEPEISTEDNFEPVSSCMLSVFLQENVKTPVWKGNPCGVKLLHEVDLLTPQLSLIWNWNPVMEAAQIRYGEVVLTAVGQGEYCKRDGAHTCLRIGWEPVMCVSEKLLCDGRINCPRGSPISDEDETLCKNRTTNHLWEKFAVEFFSKLHSPPDLIKKKLLQDKTIEDVSLNTTKMPSKTFINWKELKNFETEIRSTTEEPVASQSDSVTTALSHYGPWGYLMLGMLICGTVLMFCGLWECCFQRSRHQSPTPAPQAAPTTVLIINSNGHEEIASTQPPSYEDLDQPPSYSTLFPHLKCETFEMTERISESVLSFGQGTCIRETQSGCDRDNVTVRF